MMKKEEEEEGEGEGERKKERLDHADLTLQVGLIADAINSTHTLTHNKRTSEQVGESENLFSLHFHLRFTSVREEKMKVGHNLKFFPATHATFSSCSQ